MQHGHQPLTDCWANRHLAVSFFLGDPISTSSIMVREHFSGVLAGATSWRRSSSREPTITSQCNSQETFLWSRFSFALFPSGVALANHVLPFNLALMSVFQTINWTSLHRNTVLNSSSPAGPYINCPYSPVQTCPTTTFFYCLHSAEKLAVLFSLEESHQGNRPMRTCRCPISE